MDRRLGNLQNTSTDIDGLPYRHHLLVVHWSALDPGAAGDPGSFDAVLAELRHRIERFVPRLGPAP